MLRVILVSGGIDSYCAWHHYTSCGDGDINIPVFIDYGQSYVEKEMGACRKLFENVSILSVGKIKSGQNKDNPFIPARNLAFASLIAMIYNPDEIVMGGLRDDNVIDKSPEAFAEMSTIISKHSGKSINIISPFWTMSKGEVVEQYLKNNGSVGTLKMCISCYEGDDGHCNDCPACFRRFVALASNGIDCDVPSRRMIGLYLKKIHKYDLDRQSRTFIALKRAGFHVVAVDIDGTLTHETATIDYENRTPNIEAVDACWKLYNQPKTLLIFYTSRLESDRNVTVKWLYDNGINWYHSLIMNKLPYNILYDDLTKERFCG